jgi:hypothetical protein
MPLHITLIASTRCRQAQLALLCDQALDMLPCAATS